VINEAVEREFDKQLGIDFTPRILDA